MLDKLLIAYLKRHGYSVKRTKRRFEDRRGSVIDMAGLAALGVIVGYMTETQRAVMIDSLNKLFVVYMRATPAIGVPYRNEDPGSKPN